MPDGHTLQPAAAVAHNNRARQPNEGGEYRKAREALLAEEIELNRHIARVAAQRRALPPGGEATGPSGTSGPPNWGLNRPTRARTRRLSRTS